MRFKEYIQLSESTKDLHKAIGEKETKHLLDTKVDSKTQKMHDKVFGKGNHHIEIPFKNDMPDSVKEYIHSKGDKSHEDNEHVILKSGRTVKTTKYLGQAKAPQHIVDSYGHYHRNKSEDGNSKLVISRHKGEVASASTGTHWDSCAKAVKDGYVPGPAWEAMTHELHHGTMSALHVHKDAKPNEHGEYDSKDILGRTLIKKHVSDDGNNISYHREQKKYGAFPETANAAVDKFTKHHYPIHHEDAIHTKHEDLYDDDNTPAKYNHNATDETLHKALKTGNSYQKLATLEHPSIAGSHIHAALDDEAPLVRRWAAKHKNATPENISKALKDSDQMVKIGAISNIHANSDNIKEALKNDTPRVRHIAAMHPNASDENIHDALKNKDHETALSAVSQKNSKMEHWKAALNHPNQSIRRTAQDKINWHEKIANES